MRKRQKDDAPKPSLITYRNFSHGKRRKKRGEGREKEYSMISVPHTVAVRKKGERRGKKGGTTRKREGFIKGEP